MVRPLLDILRALHAAEIRAVVVGGVAVVLHGHARLTADLDLALDLSTENVTAVLEVLAGQGLLPRLPVAAEEFADPEIRERWRRERGLTVFSMRDPDDPRREVDLFAADPLPFEDLWAASRVVSVAGVPVRIAGIDHLIRMKQDAGRPQDLADIVALQELGEDDGADDGA